MAIESEPSPYFEPMIRNLLIGVASGGILESIHALSQVCSCCKLGKTRAMCNALLCIVGAQNNW